MLARTDIVIPPDVNINQTAAAEGFEPPPIIGIVFLIVMLLLVILAILETSK